MVPLEIFERFGQLLMRVQSYSKLELLAEFVAIWLVVYIVVRFVQGTRAAGALKGVLVVLLMATLVVRILGSHDSFQRLTYLYQTFLTITAIALIVIFQPELRRGFIRLGETRLFRGSASSGSDVIDSVVEASAYLSRARFGALMVLERDIGLRGLVEGGTAINAEVSARLLQTVFFPGTALHDLAVIINDDRIVAAGVQLPLAEPEEMTDPRARFATSGGRRALEGVRRPRGGGERRERHDQHRRARAVAARAEQRAARGGAPRPDATIRHDGARTGRREYARRRDRGRLVKRSMVDLPTILVVTIVTVLIWIWAEGESLSTKSLTTSVLFMTETDGMVVNVGGSFDGIVSVKLEGATLGMETAERVLLPGPLEFKPGEGPIPREPGTVAVSLLSAIRQHPAIASTGVTVLSVSPEQIELEIVELDTAVLPLRLVLPNGVRAVIEPTLEPASVQVTGPRAEIDKLRGSTLAVTLPEDRLRALPPGQARALRGVISLPPEAGVTPATVRLSESQFSASIALASNRAQVVLPTVPVWVLLPPTQMDGRWQVELLDPFLADVTVEGPADLIDRIKTGATTVRARVELTTDDLESGVTSESVIFDDEGTLEYQVPSREVDLAITRVGSPEG